MKAFARLTIANFKGFLRDGMAVFWFLAFPILFIFLFGMIFSGTGQQSFDVGIAVSGKAGPLGSGVQQALESVKLFTTHVGTEKEELDALKAGKRSLVVVIPESTDAAAMFGAKVTIPVYYDAGQQVSNQVLLPVVSEILNEMERRVTGRPRLFEAKPQPVQSTQFRQIDYLMPGILAMALMQLGLFGALDVISLRERKILKGLGATPLPRSSLLGSEVLVRLFMSLVQAAAIITIGHLVFKVTVQANWLVVVGLVILGAATFVSLGYMLTAFSRTTESGQGLIQVVQFPMMFLSGIFFPVEIMPAFLKPVVKAIPLTYLGDALRQVMVGAAPVASMTTDILVLVTWLVVTLALAVRFWRWE